MIDTAADGQLYVCTCCGRRAVDLLEYDDPSCADNAVLCESTTYWLDDMALAAIVDSEDGDRFEERFVQCRM